MDGMDISPPGPGEDATNNNVMKKCICDRRIRGIICNSCGYVCTSKILRTRLTCPRHPKHIFHSELTLCPNCRADLKELEEIPA